MNRSTPTVRRGDLIKASVWDAMVKLVRSLRPIAGRGITLTETPNGTIIAATPDAPVFIHPFMVSLSGKTLKVRWGQINGVDGMIGDRKIEADYGSQAEPSLELQDFKLNPNGRGWVAAEVEFAVDWSVKSWKIVQVASLGTLTGEYDAATDAEGASGASPNIPGRKARCDLAMLVETSTGVSVLQIRYFHLAHRHRSFSVAASDDGHHFFLPK